MKTTLHAIKNYAPCLAGWRALLKYLGKTEADDAPISLLTILESNGFEDALWCLRAVKGFEREKRLFAVFCAKQVKHSMNDKRSLEALEVAERYANGLATDEELKEASDAASDAAWAAADWAASVAASAASEAARAASAAWAAVHAAWAAAHAASAASDAASDAVSAAVHAAWAAAHAASDASEAARDASAASAASAAIRTGQEQEFVRMLNCIENGEVYTI